MAEFYQTEHSVVQLAISAYLGVTAVLQLIIGPLSDRYGRRPVILGGMATFLLATIGCLLAPTVEIFLVFRMLQAVIAVGMVLSRAIVRDMVPPDRAASMIGYVTMGMSLVPMLGPIIGGYLDNTFGWQASFAMVLVLGVLVMILTWFDLGETNQHQSASFRSQFRSYPELIGSRRFWGYSATAAFSAGTFFAFLGGASFISSQVLGLNSAQLGMFFAIVSVGYMLGNFISGRFSQRFGINRMMLYGTCAGAVGTVIIVLLFSANLYHPLSLFGPMSIVGLGNGMTLPNANAGMVSVRPQLAGSASGLGGTITIGGGAAISALTGALLSPQNPVMPLIIPMVIVSMMAILTALYVMHVARSTGELAAAE